MTSLYRRLFHEQQGQVLYLVAALLVCLLGMAALSIDIGFALHGQRELQASADAAASAGALALSLDNESAAAAQTVASQYSGVTGSYNAIKDLYNVTMATDSSSNKPYPEAQCLTYLQNLGLSCMDTANANAVAVRETANSPTFFGKLFGIPQIKLTASSLAAMKGGTPAPANIVVVMDTTNSMGSADNSTNCSIPGIGNPTREDCSKAGVRTFLGELAPCAAGLPSCGGVTNGNVQNAVDEVALLTFPGLTRTSLDPADYGCQTQQLTTQNGSIAPYNVPGVTPPYYTIVPASSDYRTSDTSGLNGSSSDLVKAVDWQDGNNCTSSKYGLEDNGGVSTYYAGVITEAQSDLSNITGGRASLQSAIIVLGDGDSNNATFTSAALKANPNINKNECQQAVAVAQTAASTENAANLKTWVYSVAYGALTSNSCQTDNPPTVKTASPYNTACKTMAAIASDANKFYSDDVNGCVSSAHPSIKSLTAIFQNVAYDFLNTRLLPWGTQ